MENLVTNIHKFSDLLWNPTNLSYKNIDTHSCFNMEIGNNTEHHDHKKHSFNYDDLNDVSYKCDKIFLVPSSEQKQILLCWMDAYIKMYNQTIKFFKQSYINKSKIKTNFQTVRTKYMKSIKEDICKKVNINKHILDYAIKDACTSYKSALTNLKRKNIKHFRLRYIKVTKKQKIIKIEKLLFSKDHNTFCGSILGKKINTTDNSNFKNVKTDCTLLYKHNKFVLLVPTKVEKDDNNIIKKFRTVAIDPGIRTPYTCYTEKHVLSIGSNMQNETKKYLKQIDNINKSKLSGKKKEKAIEKRYYKIENKIDEMQWKTIEYLTKNYNTILMGNMSTHNIVQTNLNKMTKRIAHLMKFYIFNERLKYKCSLTNTKYRYVNEKYTSKTCTFCGNIKNDLGANKVYNCYKCNKIIERDVNGARNIYLVDLKK